MGKTYVVEGEKIKEEDYKTLLTEELERKGLGGAFVWTIFFICVTPNILNGLHVSSYILLGSIPEDHWCEVNSLQNTSWTLEQRRMITEGNLTSKGCTIWDWDYKLLSNMTFDEALIYTTNHSHPEITSCPSRGHYNYSHPDETFVADWGLICEKSLDRTFVQFMISLGKLFGSIAFGVFADKYGRKPAVTVGSYIFIISSFLCTYASWYSLFLIGRFGLGFAAPGFFYPPLSIIIENLCFKHQSWMTVCFLMSYSFGMIVLAGAAELIKPWRDLQLSLTLPSLLLIVTSYFLNESVQWLITKRRYDEAYKLLFKAKTPYQMIPSTDMDTEVKNENAGCWTRFKEGPLKEFIALFSTPTRSRHILTSNFVFCMVTCAYYVTALNASNVSLHRNLFVALTGTVDLPSYLMPIIMLRFFGLRTTTMTLFLYTGTVNLLFLVAPPVKMFVVVLAMLGRGGTLASLSVMNLYHGEIYPTEVRNSALGLCSMWAYFGALVAPYIVDCGGLLGWYIPTTICGSGVFLAGLFHLTLPEIPKKGHPKKEKDTKEMNELYA